MKNYFQAFLRISLNRFIIQGPRIFYFKGLGMRNLDYEIAVCQKIHNYNVHFVFLKQTLFKKIYSNYLYIFYY